MSSGPSPRSNLRAHRPYRRRLATLLALALAAAPLSARATTFGSFDLSWTDRVGGTHPLIATQVSFFDSNNGTETPVATFVTDSTGHLNFSTNYSRPDGSPLNLVLDVKSVVDAVGTAGTAWGSQPFAFRLPGSYALVKNSSGTTYAPPAVTNVNDAGKAVGFMQGLKVISDYYRGFGATVPYAQVRFGSQYGNGSSMNGQLMNLGYDSWGAWDVAFHEFGHGVSDLSGLDTEPHIGAAHSFNQDNISSGPNLGPANGTTFAWQEGIATYLGTSALHARLPSAIPGMPASDSNASYDRFSSTASTTPDSSATFNVQLENRTGVVSGTTFLITAKGEGDELSVARVLWDLEDNTPGEAFPRPGRTDQVSLGGQAVYNLMKTGGGSGGRLIDLWIAARQSVGNTPESRALLGDIFEANFVSAVPGADHGVPDGGSTNSLTPTLAWTPQNSNHSDKYLVAVYSQDWSTLLELSPELLNTTSWTLADALSPGTYNWVVISNSVMQQSVDFNDSYWSGAASFVVIPEPTPAIVLLLMTPFLFVRRPHTAFGRVTAN